MLKLYQFDPKYGLPNVSPFCFKVETFLRMAKISYTNMYIQDPRKTPKGKAPYIDHDGFKLGDSAFILDYLTEKFEVKLDRDLSTHKLGISRMITGALEERLYFAMIYSRWIDDANWPEIKQNWFSDMPPIIRDIFPNVVRKNLKKTLTSHGIGRHTPEEIYAIGVKDLQGIADILGDQKYMLGPNPHSVDAVTFSFVANFLYTPTQSPLNEFTQEQLVLADYCQRMGKRYFPEYKIFDH